MLHLCKKAFWPGPIPFPLLHVDTGYKFPEMVSFRDRTLGCYPCTGAVASTAATVSEIIAELEKTRLSERTTRVIDHDQDGSMERKKREGYF